MITLEDFLNPYGYIYQIRNKINNKRYIGQTVNKRGFRSRSCKLNELLRNYNFNSYLCNSLKKYEINNFEFKIIDSAISQNELNRKEDFYIQKYNTLDHSYGYNLKCGGNNGKHTFETKKKISEMRKGKYNGKDNPNWKDGGIEHKYNCDHCGKEVIKKGCKYNKNSCHHFCSLKCYHQWEKGKKISKEITNHRIRCFFSRIYLIIEYWTSEKCMKNKQLNKLQKGILEIAKENNCNYGTIRQNLIKYDITIRTKSESKILRDMKGEKKCQMK